jgi:hypothetical protein
VMGPGLGGCSKSLMLYELCCLCLFPLCKKCRSWPQNLPSWRSAEQVWHSCILNRRSPRRVKPNLSHSICNLQMLFCIFFCLHFGFLVFFLQSCNARWFHQCFGLCVCGFAAMVLIPLAWARSHLTLTSESILSPQSSWVLNYFLSMPIFWFFYCCMCSADAGCSHYVLEMGAAGIRHMSLSMADGPCSGLLDLCSPRHSTGLVLFVVQRLSGSR